MAIGVANDIVEESGVRFRLICRTPRGYSC